MFAVEKINFQPSMFVCFFFALRLNLFDFRSVCRVCFTCMLYKVYVLGVRMFMVSSCMFYIVFEMLVEILSSAEN